MTLLKGKLDKKTVIEKCKALKDLEKKMSLEKLTQCQVIEFFSEDVIVIKL